MCAWSTPLHADWVPISCGCLLSISAVVQGACRMPGSHHGAHRPLLGATSGAAAHCSGYSEAAAGSGRAPPPPTRFVLLTRPCSFHSFSHALSQDVSGRMCLVPVSALQGTEGIISASKCSVPMYRAQYLTEIQDWTSKFCAAIFREAPLTCCAGFVRLAASAAGREQIAMPGLTLWVWHFCQVSQV